MKTTLPIACLFILLSCQKVTEENNIVPSQQEFREYFIKAGDHFSDHEAIVLFQGNVLDFKVRFDSSAIYTTLQPSNQADINKLYGFSDNNGQHHEFSARFGWRYYDSKLSLHAYLYNNGIRESKEIATIQIGKEYRCTIVSDKEKYYFVVNGVTTIMMRKATIPKPEGYKLFPYFGGDETAPHDIRIFIKEL
jgi:hypothetical protein